MQLLGPAHGIVVGGDEEAGFYGLVSRREVSVSGQNEFNEVRPVWERWLDRSVQRNKVAEIGIAEGKEIGRSDIALAVRPADED